MTNEKDIILNPRAALVRGIIYNALPMVLLVGLISYWLYRTEVEANFDVLKSHETHTLEKQQQFIAEKIRNLTADLMFLAKHTETHLLSAKSEAATATELQELFLNFSRHKKIYDQVRFLDAAGMEVVRVNYNNGDPAIVPWEQLQFKGKRYYFTDTIKLAPGNIFVSPLDLNIEHGAVEMPHKPMIRIGTVTQGGDGKAAGIVLLNYFGADMLNDLEAYEEGTLGEFMLLNRDGYWLKSADPDQEWGFMFKEKQNLTFSNRFQRAWEGLSRSNSGQFLNDKGLFTFSTIYPISESLKSSTGSTEAFAESEQALDARQYYWKIVSHINPLTLAHESRPYLLVTLLVDAVLVFLILWRSWMLTVANIKRELAEMEMHKFRNTLDQTTDGVFMFDPDTLLFFYANQGAMDQLGYTRKDFLAMTPLDIQPEFTEDRFREMIEPLQSGDNTSISFETSQRHDNGSLIPVEIMLQFVRPKRERGRFVAIVRNITKRKEAQRALVNAHQRMLTVLNSLEGLVYVVDLSSYEILFANRYAKEMVGNLEGRNCWEAIHSKKGPCDFCPTYNKENEITPDWSHIWEVQNERNGHWYENRDRVITWLDGRLVKLQVAMDITDRKSLEEEREKLISELNNAIKEIKTLCGIVPICMFCKQIRDDDGFWQQVEQYVSEHTDARFSHSVCPKCVEEHYGDIMKHGRKSA